MKKEKTFKIKIDPNLEQEKKSDFLVIETTTFEQIRIIRNVANEEEAIAIAKSDKQTLHTDMNHINNEYRVLPLYQ